MLDADRLTVGGDLFCRAGFAATGEVNLLGAHIGGTLDVSEATLTNPDGYALDLQELRAGVLLLRDLDEPPRLTDFTHAQVGALVDAPASWPRQAVLDGFVYDALYEDHPVSARQRLGWLARSPRGYSPQPYEQLAEVYRRAGRDQDARAVAIAKQRVRRRTLGLPARLWSLLLDGLVGYGYRTWLAGLWLLAFWLVGWLAFDRAHAPPGAGPGQAGRSSSRLPWGGVCARYPAARGRPAPAGSLDSPRRGAVVGLGIHSGRLGPHHRGGGSPDRDAQT